MFDDEEQDESFEETVRSIARELGRSMEQAIESVDLEGFADTIGVDPGLARDWVHSASNWLRAHSEELGDEVAGRFGQQGRTVSEAALRSAAPHPLDLPTEEQGRALAALDSGRWTLEPGTEALSAVGEGPGPSDALGIVRELYVRDWISSDGELTLAGGHALGRWLDAAGPR